MQLTYDQARVEGAKTLGDSYRHHAANPEAFVAGVQYALDSVLREAEVLGMPMDADYLDLLATRILTRAKDGEPQ